MFTGIIEAIGEIVEVIEGSEVIELRVRSELSSTFFINQSVAHNGVCLTVVDVADDIHTVQLVRETLSRSNFNKINAGDKVNLERSMPVDGRFEGHIVQGHVDATGQCQYIKDGILVFSFPEAYANLLVEKGSVCINGVSLTVASIAANSFSIALIPHTFEKTTFVNLKEGDFVNLEFDILAKYFTRMLAIKNQ